MFSSLPVIAPRDSHELWYARTSAFAVDPPYTSLQLDGNPTSQSQHLHNQAHQIRTRNVGVSPLIQLTLDEQSVDQRKLNIQRFGASWIRPPGMSKTLQGELDEKAEREDVDHHEMMDDGEIGGDGPFEVDEEGQLLDPGEQDLDADIPVAESDLDEDIPEGDSFADTPEEVDDVGVDLDDDIPEAEAETLWDDSDEGSEEDDARYESTGHDTTTGISIRGRSNSIGELDESPQQATFSHDEAWPEPGHTEAQGYDWRARARYRRDARDTMEVDSDD